ncbi:NAD(P)/FAD-dependent oxidoreductase [Paractinoplanes brasiliensis]|uniref:NADH dehydrogenase FAD-containing subunit n=1 Tax=Paractinoplanes brasiliensis TaxID=52695 RepID=A0A4R6JAL7_9ACTN|nr:FAD-dependent oxidoreductase [Actinoplanes brasiliensis]TDO31981.1 NADH dehydrogenase FAD-containing subunit [Actinoplanes brasiliensis]GID28025.1 NADH dehydrogenase [Actinoplanes brasiliensis]
MKPTTKVIVIGGGYAGVMAANRLTRRDDLTVTLVNTQPVFVERIRLHQLVARTGTAAVNYSEVLAPAVRLVVAEARTIDASAQTVTLSTGDTVGYDYLIYAVGSTGAAPGNTHAIATLADAARLRDLLPPAAVGQPGRVHRPAGPVDDSAGTVTVVGAGPTGIETAAELAEQGHTVTLIGELGPYLHPRGRGKVAATLDRLGVRRIDARVTSTGPGVVHLDDGRALPSPLTVWAAGFRVPDLAVRSGLKTDPDGRLLTDETLTSVSSPRIVAAGDAACPSGRPLRMSCQAAGPLGLHAADTVLARVAGHTPRPFVAGFLGQCVSLGRRAGIFQFARRNDVAVGAHITGRVGATVKEFVCRSTVWQLSTAARRPGLFRIPSFIGDPTRPGPAAPSPPPLRIHGSQPK